MSIDQRYFRYLDHLGTTEAVKSLHERADVRNLVALRHDVDHDLDLALEMAYWEHQRGFRATYYLLHTADYWDEDGFIDKCLQIQDFEHEVGLHVNLVAEWARGEIDDIDVRLSELLCLLREGGVEVVGVSAHGDRLCYEHNFINYWVFAELCPQDPVTEERGLSAEGVAVDDVRFQIAYPPDGVLKRDDGKVLSFWTSLLADHALEYHAYHVPYDSYLTDSGGSWVRSADPLERDFSRGRHQVLMHPVYYRGPQRFYLIMSCARSGSRWLSEVLDAGTSVSARHEFTLNNRYERGELVPDRHTGKGFRSLIHQPGELRRLVGDARAWVEEQVTGDWAEANVYLAHALPHLEHYFPEATLIHLHRHPYDVVNSLLARGWYETPDDDHHPVVDVEGWDGLTQLEKVCHYVRRVNEYLLGRGLPTLSLEEASVNQSLLEYRLADWGIASFPRLMARVHGQTINASRVPLSPIESWKSADRRVLQRICGPIAAALGYRRGVGVGSRLAAQLRYRGEKRTLAGGTSRFSASSPALLMSSVALTMEGGLLQVSGGAVESIDRQEVVVCPDGYRHTWIFLGGGSLRGAGRDEGLPVAVGTFVAARFGLKTDGVNVNAAAFALVFDYEGHTQERRRLGNLNVNGVDNSISFKPPPNGAGFTLALYVPRTPGLDRIRVARLEIEQLPLAAISKNRHTHRL